jgi:hypothetical protein
LIRIEKHRQEMNAVHFSKVKQHRKWRPENLPVLPIFVGKTFNFNRALSAQYK